ncbi:hypothetical protein DL89DRAFT_58902 [Linderina pennispora]|uniref:Uncharacterized protein n=1 Tax=Linderina pennispora TaxID=61395 RepID=A0A1Y1VZN7_9FUNG|nr:uncharacterized protein DL89DRAFT_58902 [Linderina pennispora]ORX66720.1 hypothetical protein DL89DRAFT_58902 [Linderina pennispora]
MRREHTHRSIVGAHHQPRLRQRVDQVQAAHVASHSVPAHQRTLLPVVHRHVPVAARHHHMRLDWVHQRCRRGAARTAAHRRYVRPLGVRGIVGHQSRVSLHARDPPRLLHRLHQRLAALHPPRNGRKQRDVKLGEMCARPVHQRRLAYAADAAPAAPTRATPARFLPCVEPPPRAHHPSVLRTGHALLLLPRPVGCPAPHALCTGAGIARPAHALTAVGCRLPPPPLLHLVHLLCLRLASGRLAQQSIPTLLLPVRNPNPGACPPATRASSAWCSARSITVLVLQELLRVHIALHQCIAHLLGRQRHVRVGIGAQPQQRLVQLDQQIHRDRLAVACAAPRRPPVQHPHLLAHYTPHRRYRLWHVRRKHRAAHHVDHLPPHHRAAVPRRMQQRLRTSAAPPCG